MKRCPLKDIVGSSGDKLDSIEWKSGPNFHFFRFFSTRRSSDRARKVGKSHSRIDGVKTILAALVGVGKSLSNVTLGSQRRVQERKEHFSALYPAIFPVHRPPHLRGQLNTLNHRPRFSGLDWRKLGLMSRAITFFPSPSFSVGRKAG